MFFVSHPLPPDVLRFRGDGQGVSSNYGLCLSYCTTFSSQVTLDPSALPSPTLSKARTVCLLDECQEKLLSVRWAGQCGSRQHALVRALGALQTAANSHLRLLPFLPSDNFLCLKIRLMSICFPPLIFLEKISFL
jgi:hypothetical protein